MNSSEKKMGENCCLEFEGAQTIKVKENEAIRDQEAVKAGLSFNFDRVFNQESTQKEVFDVIGIPLVESSLEGFNSTLFVYGQTSSGKTFSMQGPDITDEQLKGLIPRTIQSLFENIENSLVTIEWLVKVSIYEIYMEKIRDLLDVDRKDLKIREDQVRGIYVQNLSEFYVSEASEIYSLLTVANKNRIVASTKMNEASSRSHLLFQLEIYQKNTETGSAKTGRFILVDLAGSEKVGKTEAKGKTLDEAKKINLSLSALGNVINALTDGHSKHVPYRSSTLTRILQDSLGGNSKTSLIVTCSPSAYNVMETVSTLRFGQRAKNIKNTPKINKEYTVEELMKLLQVRESEVAKLMGRVGYLEGLLKENHIPFELDAVLSSLAEDPEKLSANAAFAAPIVFHPGDDKCTQTDIFIEAVQAITSPKNSSKNQDKELLAEAIQQVQDLTMDNQMVNLDLESSRKEIKILEEHLSKVQSEVAQEKERFKIQVQELESQVRGLLENATQLDSYNSISDAEGVIEFCEGLRSKGKVTNETLAETASKLSSKYANAPSPRRNSPLGLRFEPKSNSPNTDALQDSSKTPNLEPFKLGEGERKDENELIIELKTLASEYNSLDPYLSTLESLTSEQQLKLTPQVLQKRMEVYMCIVQQMIPIVSSLKKSLKEATGISVSQILSKLEAAKNPMAGVSDEKKVAIQLKINALERQLSATQAQVIQYKKNCTHLSELLKKQPQLVNQELVTRIASINISGGATKPDLSSERILFGKSRQGESGDEDLPSVMDELLDQRLESFKDSHQLNNKSVIHSYLSRNPRIIKHIKGGLNQKTDTLPLAPQDPAEKKWSVLKLLGKLCLRVEDEMPSQARVADRK